MSEFVIRLEFLEPVTLLGVPRLTVGSAWPGGVQVSSAVQVDELQIDFTMASSLTSSEVVFLPSWDKGLRGPNGEWISGFQVQVTNVGPITNQIVMGSIPFTPGTADITVIFSESVIINAVPINWSWIEFGVSETFCTGAVAVGIDTVQLTFGVGLIPPGAVLRVPLGDESITNAAGWPLAGGIFLVSYSG